ncbi:hypothetical protein LCGC14_1673190 [marine sediment metagenome]|uniref:Uncharacterized protein n=1 Tax=marine sediment metagenome TaxID=412755 RepID=A0A0F9HQQ7_9ZZZZ
MTEPSAPLVSLDLKISSGDEWVVAVTVEGAGLDRLRLLLETLMEIRSK